MRRRQGERVFGPYKHGTKWRLHLTDEGGEVSYRSYESRERAEAVKKEIERELASGPQTRTVDEAIEEYKAFMRDVKQNKERSYTATLWRLRSFFVGHLETEIGAITKKVGARLYADLTQRQTRFGKVMSVDSHRNILAEARTFLDWCVSKRWASKNPLDDVQGIGRRKHGKPQLRIDEARRWSAVALDHADSGDAGAVAALMTLIMGMRCSEVVSRVVRDLDDKGTLLWIPDSKTEAGKRTLTVPPVLQPYLETLGNGKRPEDLLFGKHWRDWPRLWVQRICREAGVMEVSAHAMRGLHSTLSLQTGSTPEAVAAALGHESSSTTMESYADRERVAEVKQRRVLKVLGN